jgi:hypothetical protein
MPDILGFSVWNFLSVTHLMPRILRWLLDFLKICAPLFYTILKIVGTGKHHDGYSLQVLYAVSLQLLMYLHPHKPRKTTFYVKSA